MTDTTCQRFTANDFTRAAKCAPIGVQDYGRAGKFDFQAMLQQAADMAREREQLQTEVIRLQRAKVSDSEIIGRWQCQAERAESILTQVRALAEGPTAGITSDAISAVEYFKAGILAILTAQDAQGQTGAGR